MCGRIKWSTGNGQNFSFIQDDWVPTIGSLRHHLIPGMSISPIARVVAFVNDDGNWNWSELELFFHKDILDRIVACHPPNEDLGEDVCMWKLSSNGNFIVRMAYNSVIHDDTNMDDAS